MQAIELLLKNPRTLTADELLAIKTASINDNIFLDIVSDLVSAVDKLEFAKLSSADPEDVDNQYESLVKIASKILDFVDTYEVMFPEAVEAILLGMEKSAGFGKFVDETLGRTIKGFGRMIKHPIAYGTMGKRYLDNKGFTNMFTRARALGEGEAHAYESFIQDLKTTKFKAKQLKRTEKSLKKQYNEASKKQVYNSIFDPYRTDVERQAKSHVDPEKIKARLNDISEKRRVIETEKRRGTPYSVARQRYVEYKKNMQQAQQAAKKGKNVGKGSGAGAAAAAAVGGAVVSGAVTLNPNPQPTFWNPYRY